ncbi:MAG: SGNH/GDSL hydrolase family protein [Solirubrobacterales bacterium]|nr:SGNH/GDSL hydrolase family protein [Solirubrobacterales bacterium]
MFTVVVLCASSAAASAKAKTDYYLALGDSLSVGYQPNKSGVGTETKHGYVNDLYAAARKHDKNLKLVQLGCPGDTTASMLTGKGNATEARLFHCNRSHGSQLQAAVAFLKAHHAKGEVPLVTIDIGANDVDGCMTKASSGIGALYTCIADGEKTIQSNLPKILKALRTAAPGKTVLSGMNLYDPLLAGELSSDQTQAGEARLSTQVVRQVNTLLAGDDKAAHFRTADVANAFETYDTRPTSTKGSPLAATNPTVPRDVAEICKLTWMCAPKPVGPNIHANASGYATIAEAFQAVGIR